MLIREIIGYISEGDYATALVQLAALAFIVFCTLPVHEFAHAWTAVKLGDDTPRLKGRLTLNPMAHLNWLGVLMIVLVGFGYAKPVPVNIHNLKNGRKSFALVAAAGPLSNLIMALLFYFCNAIVMVLEIHTGMSEAVYAVLTVFFTFAAEINVALAVFNLLPIPPLDGSRLLTLVLPQNIYYKIMRYEQYIIIAVFALLFFGILTIPLNFLDRWVGYGLQWIAELPFRLTGAL